MAPAAGSQALALEELLEGRGLVRKAAGAGLLTGLGARLTRASALPSRGAARESLPTGVDELDRLLSGGLPRGGFVEIVARRSSGRFSLGLSVLASATSCGESAALVDVGGHLDPQSAEDAGVDLTRLLWVRPEKLKHAVAAAEMLLATGFALVVVDLGVPPVRGRFVPDAAWLRLERAARDRGAVLLLLSPYRVGATAEAVVALDAARPVWCGERNAPPMLSGIGTRMTLQKDAAAKEGARGALRMAVDPVMAQPSGIFGARAVRSVEMRGESSDLLRSAARTVEMRGEVATGSSPFSPADAALISNSRPSSTVVGAGLDPAPSRREIGRVTHPSAPPVTPVEDKRNPSPQYVVLPNGEDGRTPFPPPSPFPGEGGPFFPPPAPFAASTQLSLLP